METVELTLEELVAGGDALARSNGRVVFVPFGAPGERVRVALDEERRDYARGHIVEVLEPAPARVEPPCPYFGACGGCQLQHLDYPTQLMWKRRIVAEQLRRIGGFADADELVRPTIGMVEPWEYRNHARFSIGRRFGELGYTYRNSHRLLRVERCAIVQPAINRVLWIGQGKARGAPSHQLAVRHGAATSDTLISPVLPALAHLSNGRRDYLEELLGRRFRVPEAAFFQINTRRERRLPGTLVLAGLPESEGEYSMADLLALLVVHRLQPQPGEVIVDAYSGVGTFAALIAERGARVIAIEEAPAAVAAARENTSDLANLEVVAGRTEEVLPRLSPPVEGMVLDPARVGCQPAAIEAIARLAPTRLVYVSCEPATLARDLRLLSDRGYRLLSVEPLDMFPQTAHIECVSTLSRAA